jgi:hypothetical protein
MTCPAASARSPGTEQICQTFERPPREMPVALAVVLVVVVGLISFRLGMLLRTRRTPSELHSDWWTEFEREFRIYAARVCDSPSSRDRRRRSI